MGEYNPWYYWNVILSSTFMLPVQVKYIATGDIEEEIFGGKIKRFDREGVGE